MACRYLDTLLLGLTVGIATVGPASADGSWLDGPRTNWNQAGLEIPQAPPMEPALDPRCPSQLEPPSTPEGDMLTAKGWTVFGNDIAGEGVRAVKGLSGYDGMCRPMGFQEFVFVDGMFAGTISPVLMNSRDDGVGGIDRVLGPDSIHARFLRYGPGDPLCCASGSADVTYKIDRSGPAPLLVPLLSDPGAGSGLVLTAADSGRSIDLAIGDDVTVVLDANPTTGYSWRLADGLDQAVLVITDQQYTPPAASVPGAGGTDAWTFEAADAGTTTITLEYVRPFEPNNVVRQFTIAVNVADRP
jgi:predicted secreted protein